MGLATLIIWSLLHVNILLVNIGYIYYGKTEKGEKPKGEEEEEKGGARRGKEKKEEKGGGG
ncbi:hypothetical protein GTI73_15230 [Enterococcus faecalis]|nr:hypothetical protein [Enterococcus faecalis]